MRRIRRRAAFALPEALLAILLLAIGILGLASAATAIAAQSGDARALSESSLLAGAVLDSLRASPCHGLSSGVRRGGGASVTWSVAASTRTITVRTDLSLVLRGRVRRWTFESLLPCER